MKKKICVITGSRAEYGLFSPLLKQLRNDRSFQLQIIAAGMHLSSVFGSTFKEIEKDGFLINEKVYMRLGDDSPAGITRSMGAGMIGFAGALKRLAPDLVLVLGDRFEIFAAAAACHTARIPLAHFYGGDLTEGAIDDAFRHCITKMSLLHFVSTEACRRRVIQLGEAPSRVFNIGSLGIDNILNLPLLERAELEKEIGFQMGVRNILVTFHPVTLEAGSAEKQCKEMLNALDSLGDCSLVFTGSNADTEGRIILKLIREYIGKNRGKAAYFASLGAIKYLSVMKYSDMVLGNSSSGIVEAPSFGIPTVNIGDRQKGRVQPGSVINCGPRAVDIRRAIWKARSPDFRKKCSKIINPYGDGNSAAKAVKRIKEYFACPRVMRKSFYDIRFWNHV